MASKLSGCVLVFLVEDGLVPGRGFEAALPGALSDSPEVLAVVDRPGDAGVPRCNARSRPEGPLRHTGFRRIRVHVHGKALSPVLAPDTDPDRGPAHGDGLIYKTRVVFSSAPVPPE
jgi:hypothetical protein